MMHKLAEINNLPAALLFTDYCQSKGLHVIAEPVGNGAIQLYCDEDCKEQVTDLLKVIRVIRRQHGNVVSLLPKAGSATFPCLGKKRLATQSPC